LIIRTAPQVFSVVFTSLLTEGPCFARGTVNSYRGDCCWILVHGRQWHRLSA
jgi:hypothetical protein